MDEEHEPQRPIGAIDAALLLGAFVIGPQLLLHLLVLVLSNLRGESYSLARELVASHPIFGGLAQLVVGGALLAFAQRYYARGRKLDIAFGLHSVSGREICLAALVGMTLQIPLAEVSNLVEMISPVSLDEKLRVATLLQPESFIEGLGLVIAAVAIAPVMEELFFRGLLLPGVSRGSGLFVGVCVSTLAFGIAHMKPTAVAVALVGGLVLAFITVRLGSIIPAIVTHAANNALPVMIPAKLLPLAGVNVVTSGPSHVHPALLALSLLTCATALAMLVSNHEGE